MNKRRVSFLSILLLALLLLTACSSSGVSEKQVKADLEKSSIYADLAVDTTEFSVIKRQTDEATKTDLVYVTIKGENKSYSPSTAHFSH